MILALVESMIPVCLCEQSEVRTTQGLGNLRLSKPFETSSEGSRRTGGLMKVCRPNRAGYLAAQSCGGRLPGRLKTC